MNLVTDPWIPVMRTASSTTEQVGLLEAFEAGEDILDLAVNPVQRIALMRLLICIAQRALNGPEDEDDWLSCRSRIACSAAAYLNQWKGAFDLYGDKPFLQIPDLEVKEGKAKTVDFLSSPNNTALFEHELGSMDCCYADADLARHLVCFFSFSTGGKVGQSIWQGRQIAGSTFAAPCLNFLHMFLMEETLIGSIRLNLLTKTGTFTGVDKMQNTTWGLPVWERMPNGPDDNVAFENAVATYLGRLVPLSRLVKLRGNDCIAGPIPKRFVMQHLPIFRESTSTVHVGGKESSDPKYRRVKCEEHMWRELHSLLAWRANDFSHTTGPPALFHLEQQAETSEKDRQTIWVGGLQIGANAGKLRDMAEWRFEFDPRFVAERSRKTYAAGVDICDEVQRKALTEAVKTFTKHPQSPADGGKTESGHRQGLLRKVREAYWSQLDSESSKLTGIAVASQPDLDKEWWPVAKLAALDAYETTCPRATPRQIVAYAAGMRKLRLELRSMEPRNAQATAETIDE